MPATPPCKILRGIAQVRRVTNMATKAAVYNNIDQIVENIVKLHILVGHGKLGGHVFQHLG